MNDLRVAFPDEGFNLDEFFESLERQIIWNALEDNAWKQTHTAAYLGLSTRALNYKINKFDWLKEVEKRSGRMAKVRRPRTARRPTIAIKPRSLAGIFSQYGLTLRQGQLLARMYSGALPPWAKNEQIPRQALLDRKLGQYNQRGFCLTAKGKDLVHMILKAEQELGDTKDE